ncbi:MAG: Rieske 2Fe-2S domain-containing protein [Hydrococcus sp. SU_1_0]|nr:Rieske 2Fe-2S domain-containing protein [Hydrococcus sp. SU_1_0]
MIAAKTPMYEGSPWCIGSYDSFKVNQPKLITLLGHDYVIWRDETENLNAIDNICPHAGANLAKGGYVVDFQGKKCLACPYHGNKVQFFGDGTVIIDSKVSSRAIQQVLPLQVVDRLVWTYGLEWREEDGKLVAQPIEPKLPIPNYLNVPDLRKGHSQLKLEGLNHIYSHSESVNCNLAQAIWNIHDGEHFAGTHRDTMLSQEIEIKNLTQNEHQLSWQLILHKRSDRAIKNNKLNFLVEKVFVQSFNVFLPSLAVITLNYQGKLIVGIVTMYPESPQRVRLCLDSYTDLNFTWWQKLIRLPQMANLFRDRLIFEDIAILENLYETFDHKITLKNDTPAELALNYLQTWSD